MSLGKPNLKVIKHKLRNVWDCLSCRPKKPLNYFIYENGMKAVSNDLDLFKIVKTIKKLKVASRMLLKDYHKPLIKYAAAEVISSTRFDR